MAFAWPFFVTPGSGVGAGSLAPVIFGALLLFELAVVLAQLKDTVRARAIEVLEAAGEEPGHVFNLGHGILPETPIAAVETLVETVTSHARRLV